MRDQLDGIRLGVVAEHESAGHGRQRNPRGEGARLRAEILEATRKIIADGETVTLRCIARTAGVAAPSIYRHFADLDAIMLAVAEQAFDEIIAALTKRRDEQSSASAGLRAICTGYLDFAHERPHLYGVMFGGVWNAANALEQHPTDEERLRGIGMSLYALLVDALQECVDDGSSESVDVRQDATALWVALHGLADLRETVPLFPWPPSTDEAIVTSLARLR